MAASLLLEDSHVKEENNWVGKPPSLLKLIKRPVKFKKTTFEVDFNKTSAVTKISALIFMLGNMFTSVNDTLK